MQKKRGHNLILYNKLTRQAKAILSKKKDIPPMSWREIQKFTSSELYPKFKGQSARKVTIKSIREAIETKPKRTRKKKVHIEEEPRIECASVFKVPESDIISTEWFDLKRTLAMLPPNVNIRVNAGNYGITNIAHNSEIDYYLHIKAIIDELRAHYDTIGEWTGTRRLVPGKKDNGGNCNYFIEFTLTGDDEQIQGAIYGEPEELTEDEIRARMERIKRAERDRQAAAERRKLEVVKEQPRPDAEEKEEEPATQKRKGKKQPPKKPEPIKLKGKGKKKAPVKKTPVKKISAKQSQNEAVKEAISTLRELYKDGLLSKEEFLSRFDQLTKKLEKGGPL